MDLIFEKHSNENNITSTLFYVIGCYIFDLQVLFIFVDSNYLEVLIVVLITSQVKVLRSKCRGQHYA